MIFVHGWIKIPEDELEAAIHAASAMVLETVKEPGCLHYSFAKDITKAGLIHISERWDSEESLNAHFETPHMSAFNMTISGLTIEAMDIRLYSGEEVRVMMQS
jgi:quinol monooxygenase YgiN